MARYCERCGAVFPLSDSFYNRIRLYAYDPERDTTLKSTGSTRDKDFLDKEFCHNCVVELETWLKES